MRLEYETTLETWRMLADVRFKLLALVPAVSGVAIAILSKEILGAGLAAKPPPEPVLAVSILGFLVTLGITMYDQRNSQISNWAFHHARKLEAGLGLPQGGHLLDRPGKEDRLRLFGTIAIWHDRGLAIIYGSVLGAWVFPMTLSSISLFTDWKQPSLISAIVASICVIAFVIELHQLDEQAQPTSQNEVAEQEQTPDPDAE